MNAASLIQAVKDRFPEAVTGAHSYRGDATVLLCRELLLEVARALKDDAVFRMNMLVDLTAVDFSSFGKKRPPAFFASSGVAVGPSPEIPDQDPWPGPPAHPPGAGATLARFVVVYHLFSLPLKHRLRLEVPVEDVEEADPEVDSVTSVWAGADWLEREVWDMFGIRFRGHPNLKRILMYDEFVGHPLRKDYPVNKRQPLIGPVN
ncbi:MAG: NADH-quinone oxidoreductase subunit C [Acidobacteria bacterium]|nr:NADH-quinone oxidoreductase subunit C [Acidobacteriota bacterium]